ncbi:2-amino-4-hydroxy-6-hydroxymethyldihydropteridine diphosphokinase [Porphyromonas sp.]|uniref:2-amino-4-hydroxy-6- hydroxymethyldihydropteridine diphosphokinase n=1 Tax=Porphyromonas sp. TaxID=1924944 RepID=UPI0026DC6E76|nr:2-amino-4-hydroxy-6-hydroxymethyldihydropteridine diphosphokinase [Porphyromonas sp.]MDO4695485.1 2-amino-4-hydroxy-6-hydroxymethyldihydropteridine diphosphokinase [Porphyromonas sp.]MDO4770281.1 2-amino-4-hydroxy-6-hydroxymethyldihydropteridine diphosphokinase [Porphyromonas sp.]
MVRSSRTYYLGLGSNIGDTQHYLSFAREAISRHVGEIIKESTVIYSEPEGFESANTFSNQVIAVRSSLRPKELLAETQRIERELGRTHKSHDGTHYDRTIDIDIILCGDLVYSDHELTIPHKEFRTRSFVINLLKEVAPEMVDPVTQKTMKDLAQIAKRK